MTKKEIIEMARKAGLVSPYKKYKDWIEAGPSGDELKAFAKLVAEKSLQRTWVGLTDEEMIALSEMQLGSWDLILEVEAKLKERNT
jgi:hypothetical protein